MSVRPVNNHVCMACGTPYYACNGCERTRAWRAACESYECYEAALAFCEYRDGRMTAEAFAKYVDDLGYDAERFIPSIKEAYDLGKAEQEEELREEAEEAAEDNKPEAKEEVPEVKEVVEDSEKEPEEKNIIKKIIRKRR